MIPVAVTATPARALPDRGSDGTSRDDGFGAVLAAQDVAPGQADGAPTQGPTKPAVAGAGPGGRVQANATTGQGIAALLAKLADGVTSGPAGTSASGAAKETKTLDADGDPSAPAKKEKTTAVAVDAPPTANADPLAAIAAFLPGIVTPAAPPTVTPAVPPSVAGQAAKATEAVPTNSGPSIGEGAITKTFDIKPDTTQASVDIALVGSAGHLAPARLQAAGPPASAGSAKISAQPKAETSADTTAPAKDVKATDAGKPPVAATKTASDRETPVASVASHAQPDAGLSDATFQTLAGAVTTLAGEAAAPSLPSPAAAVPADLQTPQLAPARSLTLQLTPNELGSVTVRLHLSGDGLDVHLAVEDQKTLAAITHARDALTSAIGDNGYKVGSLVIQSADASSTSTAGSNDSAHSQSETGAGRSSSGGDSAGDGSSQRQRDPRAPSPRDASLRDTNSRSLGGNRGAGGVFV